MAYKNVAPSKLMEAVRAGNVQGVVSALEGGADVDEADVHGFRGLPLRTACFSGHCAIVRELLARGANIDAGTADGPGAPLRLALRASHRQLVTLLLDEGAAIPSGIAIDPELIPSTHPHALNRAQAIDFPYDNLIEFSDAQGSMTDTHLATATGTETNVLTMDLLRFNESDDATVPSRERNLDQELLIDPEHMWSSKNDRK